MRNAFRGLLFHQRRRGLLSSPCIAPLGDFLIPPRQVEECLLMRPAAGIRIRSPHWVVPFHFALIRQLSTGYTSVHGERPSAEYAKLRKESLETEFGHILGAHGSKTWFAYHRFGPFLALYRAAIISFYLAKLTVWHFFVRDIHKRAAKFRKTLIRLGPFYIKLGQALSTRPDILPSAYCQELSKLQDQIPPFSTRVAIKSIESQLGLPICQIFADISSEPIAAASLGQVYKVTQLIYILGSLWLSRCRDLVRHMFDEIDYILEAQHAEKFASLYASIPRSGSCVKVPKIYWNFTRKAVLTMEWIDGIKLTDARRISEASLNKKQLIDQGLYCSLRQLLEEGFFHADPHPGNLVATDDGSLAYFDFGMMGDIPWHYRVGLIRMLVHYVNRDSSGLANDFLSLGFIPDGTDIQLVADALHASFGDGSRQSNDFQGIMDQLYAVMYEFNFYLPPDYALVIRALGSLEGTAKALDPDFKVVESAYPFVIGRLLADPNPDMRKILRELIIRSNGSIRWNRLERLIAAISEQSSESANETPLTWKTFDMRSVVAATEDLFCFILSEKGWRVRVFLIQDIVKAADAFLEEEALPCICNKPEAKERFDTEQSDALVMRLISGFRSLQQAISFAPEVWTAMFLRTLLKSDTHRFLLDIFLSLAVYSRNKMPETFFLCISRLLHLLEKGYDFQEDT
ncbi:uncharacterized protein LOC135585227 isoform X5 [Musa acuminata AAA Group]|uniref:uncharacterized protein LOC135585227 isoform X5 n=1 Tax=Musa acuminata AAA Group TaxID=214697 RepID=UPI0031D80A94